MASVLSRLLFSFMVTIVATCTVELNSGDNSEGFDHFASVIMSKRFSFVRNRSHTGAYKLWQ